jgi:hypothetical protein
LYHGGYEAEKQHKRTGTISSWLLQKLNFEKPRVIKIYFIPRTVMLSVSSIKIVKRMPIIPTRELN